MKYSIIIGVVLFLTHAAHSQTSEAKLKIDPTTNCKIRYLYFPNLEAYYDNTTNMYLYKDKGIWTSIADLPKGFRGYSIYNNANVPITDFDDDDVTQMIKVHRQKYPYINGRKTRELAATSH